LQREKRELEGEDEWRKMNPNFWVSKKKTVPFILATWTKTYGSVRF